MTIAVLRIGDALEAAVMSPGARRGDASLLALR